MNLLRLLETVNNIILIKIGLTLYDRLSVKAQITINDTE
jgi:hypothetical protein